MIDLNKDSHEGKILSWVRFPLACLVVFIHTGYTTDKTDIGYYVGKLISDGIASIAVPTFFFISGYLFFAKYQKFGVKEYLSAMKRKFFSLVVPYILWISLVFYGYGLYSGSYQGLQPWDVYHIFWAHDDGFVVKSLFGYKFSILSSPAGLGVLWFIRDLIVVMALSPLVWVIVRKLKMWSLLIFLLPYLLTIGIPIHGFGLVAMCFFPLGATFSICGKDVIRCVTRCGGGYLGLFTILLVTKYAVDISDIQFTPMFSLLAKLLILSGIPALLYLADKTVKHDGYVNKALMTLGEVSFLLYIGHTLPVFLPLRHITEAICYIPYLGNTIAYFFSWGIRTAIIIAGYYIVKKYMPTLLSILVGGRIKSNNVNRSTLMI